MQIGDKVTIGNGKTIWTVSKLYGTENDPTKCAFVKTDKIEKIAYTKDLKPAK